MITIHVNSEAKQIDNSSSIAEALTAWGYQSEKIALAINGEFVPRTEYNDHYFQAGDQVDVVAPIQGG